MSDATHLKATWEHGICGKFPARDLTNKLSKVTCLECIATIEVAHMMAAQLDNRRHDLQHLP